MEARKMFNEPPTPILLWLDGTPRSGASHMAIDEALLEQTDCPMARFYTWPRSEITIGLFTPLDAISKRPEPATRRRTGGGIVEHGEDLTFSLAVPRSFLPPRTRAIDWYRGIHEALALALSRAGMTHAVAVPTPAATADRPAFCFTMPVTWDVMWRDSDSKIAGGAQWYSRAGLLHQGSVRLPEAWRLLDHPWITDFAALLSGGGSIQVPPREFIESVCHRADRLERERYAHPEWRDRR